MTKEKLIEINKLKSEMDKSENQIRDIDLLINSCGLYARISGTPKGRFSSTIEFSYKNKEILVAILLQEKTKLTEKLIELNEQFEKL